MGKHFDGYLVEGLGGIFFKKDIPIKDFHSALNVFKTESSGGLIHFFHVALGNAFAVVVNSDIKIIISNILCKVNETCVAMFEDVIYKFLCYPENKQFSLWDQSISVVVEPATRIDRT